MRSLASVRPLACRAAKVAGAATVAVLALMSGAAQAKGKTFALIQYNQQVSFFTDITKGAQKAADEAGDKLVVFDANNSASAQDNAFDTYVQQKAGQAEHDQVDRGLIQARYAGPGRTSRPRGQSTHHHKKHK